MKTTIYISFAIAYCIALPVTVVAQDTLTNRNVTVVREYKPVIHDAGKLNSVPEVLEPVVSKTAPVYTNFNLPLNLDYNIHTLSAAELKLNNRSSLTKGYARIGAGVPFNTMADFAYPIIKKEDMRLDFSLNHLGTYGKKAHSTTAANLSFDKYFKTLDFYAGLGGSHEYLKYYGNNFNRDFRVVGLDTLASLYGNSTYQEQNLVLINRNPQTLTLNNIANDSTSDTFWRFDAFMGVRSLPNAEIRYLADMQYKVFDSHNGPTEHLIRTTAGFSAPRGENRLGIDVEMDNMLYRSDKMAAMNFWDSYSVFSLNPYYSIERTSWNVRLGVKAAVSFIHGKPFNPSPDIRAEWKVAPKWLSLYGGITGNYQVNTMNEMFGENRYLYSDVRVKDTYTPFDFYAGLKVKPLYNLLVDAYMDYRYINNQYFFVNKQYTDNTTYFPYSTLYTNRFNVLYSGASHLKIGLRANYNYCEWLNIQLKGAYNSWDVKTELYAWNKPKWETDFSTSVRVMQDLSLSANVFYEDGRYAKLGNSALKMKQKMDINLSATYAYTSSFSIFVKLNNLLNRHYQDFYGYDVQGINILAGGAFSF